jgi:hypothetical protein
MDLMKQGLASQQAAIDANKFVMSECQICQRQVAIHPDADPLKTACCDEHAQKLKEYEEK